MRVNQAVGAEVIERLQPLGIEAAIGAIEARRVENAGKLRQLELAIDQARYEAARARRQYDAVDPENRLVAGELEQRWNERLLALRAIEDERDQLASRSDTALTATQREHLLSLGADIERAWHSCGATPQTRKRIIRTLIEEIIVRIEDDELKLVIRWVGSDHTLLRVRTNRSGQHRWTTGADVVDVVTALARHLPDKHIAYLLNRGGMTTGRGNGWTHSRVCSLRNHRGIAAYREGERAERGEATLDEAAAILKISQATVRRLITEDKVLQATQFCKGAPWVIRLVHLETEDVKRAADVRRLRRPPSQDQQQNSLAL